MESINYKFTGVTKEVKGRVVKEIVAMDSFNGVKEGQVGGYIESLSNLTTDDRAWIEKGVIVLGESVVSGSSYLSGNIIVENSLIRDSELILRDDKASVVKNSEIYESTIDGVLLMTDSNTESCHINTLGDVNIVYDIRKSELINMYHEYSSKGVVVKNSTISSVELNGTFIVTDSSLAGIDVDPQRILISCHDYGGEIVITGKDLSEPSIEEGIYNTEELIQSLIKKYETHDFDSLSIDMTDLNEFLVRFGDKDEK